jgi:hypothetical protein
MSTSDFELDELKIVLTSGARSLLVEWKGASDSPDPVAALGKYLDELAGRAAGRAVTIDLRELQFMNSASVVPLLSFVRQLDRLGVPTRLMFDGRVHWQRVQCSCMKAIARTLKHVEVEMSQVEVKAS